MSSLNPEFNGPAYWRSLQELADPAGLDRATSDVNGSTTGDTSRREFLRLMAASMAMATGAGCRRVSETIVPYARRPADRLPGVPAHFATAMDLAGVGTGLVATSYDGRPIKIEGNELHPYSLGATSAIMQAAVLELYDPDRSGTFYRGTGKQRTETTRADFAEFIRHQRASIQESNGAGLCILAEASSSPSLAAMRSRLLAKYPRANWYEYEPISRDHEREGAKLAFGRPYRTHLDLARADTIVSLDADLLMTHPAAIRHARDFASRRRAADGTMNRLYLVESGFSVTGTMADRRWAVRPDGVGNFAIGLIDALIKHGLELPLRGLSPVPPVRVSWPWTEPEIDALARELLARRGRSLLAAGYRQSPELHALAHLLNHSLDNTGRTLSYTADPDVDRPSHVQAIGLLNDRMQAGDVDTLLILGGDPAVNAPADMLFADAIRHVPTSVHLSLYDNRTSQECGWHVPRAHWLETWGDVRAYDGTVSIAQPLIEPLHGGVSAIELIALLIEDELTHGYDIVGRTFAESLPAGADFAEAWHATVESGVRPDSAWPRSKPALPEADWDNASAALIQRALEMDPERIDMVVVPDHKIHDGRFANNGWLQELPDPITKLTWGNAALIAPATAKRLEVVTGDVITLRNFSPGLEVPVFVLPGHAENCITLPLGYGLVTLGTEGGNIGADVHTVRTKDAFDIRRNTGVGRKGRRQDLATTQMHHTILGGMEHQETRRRAHHLVRQVTLSEHLSDSDTQSPVTSALSPQQLWNPPPVEADHRWGMAIDLSACTGCSACVIACQAENNIPIVGEREVRRGREMHWIRIDRYFTGPPETPAVVHQPVMCHHCENAPCEQVCPVAATVHSREGLNDQVYSRCIGVRYCENNCPYKVRRFNWFNNHDDETDVERMVYNPGVTLRSRGVMEKCTYCVQRIEAARRQATIDDEPIRDGDVVPACAQACPTQAIVFGDLNDPNSRVRKLHDDARSYGMLAELNVRPRTRYLTRLTNPPDHSEANG